MGKEIKRYDDAINFHAPEGIKKDIIEFINTLNKDLGKLHGRGKVTLRDFMLLGVYLASGKTLNSIKPHLNSDLVVSVSKINSDKLNRPKYDQDTIDSVIRVISELAANEQEIDVK